MRIWDKLGWVNSFLCLFHVIMEDQEWAVRVHFALLLNGLSATLDHFRENWRNIRPTTHQAFHESILRAFDRGDSSKFFEGMTRYVPQTYGEGEMGKVEFYCHVYFTTLPVVSNQKEKWPGALQRFKEFLNTKGADLSKTSGEFLQFYALPHVPSPQTHPSFKHFFTHSWSSELRERLRLFLESVQSKAEKMVTSGLSVPGPNLALQEDLRKAKQRENYIKSALVESQNKWTAFSLSILQIGKQLLEHIEGEGTCDLPAVRRRLAEFERFLTTPGDDTTSNTSSLIPVAQKEQLVSLDYSKIRIGLARLDDWKRCALLQALRWRLTRTPASVRREVMQDYIVKDLLRAQEQRLAGFLMDCGPRLLDYLAKLVNVFASECRGRTYLLQDSQMVQALIQVLYRESEDTTLRQNAIGTLQKLSLRRRPQATMIDLHMIEWLCDVLRHSPDLSEYSLEYSTALLMNLSLRTAGKNMCEDLSLGVLQLLQSLLEHENPQVRTYINGTLYSILSRPVLKVRARDMGLESKLRRLLSNSDEMLQKQIQYIIDQLNADGEESSLSDEDADDDDQEGNEDDETEQISDDEDDVEEDGTGLIGEELLRQEFSLTGDSISSVFEEAKVSERKPEAEIQESADFTEPKTPTDPVEPLEKREATPAEFKAKPKVPRTPQILPMVQVSSQVSKSKVGLETRDPAFPSELLQPSGQVEETRLKHAFQTRSRIQRTPPKTKAAKGSKK